MSSDDDTTEPTELEKARAAFEAMTKAMLDAGRRYEERMNAATTAALSAANVPALLAEVERLRVELEAARGRVEASDEGFAAVQTEWHAALARATSAEQERDRLRAEIEALAQQVEWNERNGAGIPPIQARHLRALLAGSGEQPAPTALVRVEWGVVLDDLGSTDVYDTREEAEARAVRDSTVVRIETWRVGSGEQPGACDGCGRPDDGNCNCPLTYDPAKAVPSRPAPVVPDSPRWCRTCQGYGDHHTDGHPLEAVPDSPDVLRVAADAWEDVERADSPDVREQVRKAVRQHKTEWRGDWPLGHYCPGCSRDVEHDHQEQMALAVVRSGEQGGEG